MLSRKRSIQRGVAVLVFRRHGSPGLEEQFYNPPVPAPGGDVQGSPAGLIRAVWVCLAAQQGLDDRHVALGRRQVDRGCPLGLAPRIDVRSPREQILDRPIVPNPRREVQGRHPVLVRAAEVSTLREELLRDLAVAFERREVQRQGSVLIGLPEVRASAEELPRDLHVAPVAGEVQGGALPQVDRLDVSPSAEELDHGLQVPLLGGPVKRRLALLVRRIDVGPSVQEPPDGAVLPALRREDQRRHAELILGLNVGAQVNELVNGPDFASPGGPVEGRLAGRVLCLKSGSVPEYKQLSCAGVSLPGCHVKWQFSGLGFQGSFGAQFQQQFHKLVGSNPSR
mmetsp:Transcript_27813/g.66087  ORF Transcript_27813/g.66087 Transcript_27813/m.66087 type:complete len:339 (+) Transcript_27813:1138-2154(+)